MSLRSFGLGASRLLTPEPAAVDEVRTAVAADEGWRSSAIPLLGGGWRDQVTAAAALAVAEDADPIIREALWRAIDGASWVVPQLVAAALIADREFELRAAQRLNDAMRRPPKTTGALVRAYHRCPQRRMAVVAQLGRHDRTMVNEEARIGVRGVDAWLDYFGR